MRKLLLAPLAVAFTLVAASASAAGSRPSPSSTLQFLRRRRASRLIAMATSISASPSTGEVRKIAPDGTQSTLALLPLHQEVQPCQNSAGSASSSRHRPGSPGQRLRRGEIVQRGRPRYLEGDARRPAVAARQSAWRPLSPGSARPNGIAYHRGWLYVADSASRWSGGSTLTARALRRSGPTTRCWSTRPSPRRGFQGRMACRSSITRSTSPSRTAHTSWPSASKRMGRPAPAACTSRSGSTTSPST